jgi:hypothetical protein
MKVFWFAKNYEVRRCSHKYNILSFDCWLTSLGGGLLVFLFLDNISAFLKFTLDVLLFFVTS